MDKPETLIDDDTIEFDRTQLVFSIRPLALGGYLIESESEGPVAGFTSAIELARWVEETYGRLDPKDPLSDEGFPSIAQDSKSRRWFRGVVNGGRFEE